MGVLSLSIAGLLYVCLWTDPKGFSIQNHPCPQSKTSHLKNDLEVTLKKTSMTDKTLIIAIVDKAYVEENNGTNYPSSMLDLFLESFWVGEDTRPLLDHLLLVAMDQTAYDRCKFRRLHCYKLVTDGVDFTGGKRDKFYLTDDFHKMMWRRTEFLLDVLKHGYNFIFTDADIMWLRNPFSRLKMDEKDDLQISIDWNRERFRSKTITPNSGFYLVKSNKRSIAFYEKWYGMRNNSRWRSDQGALTALIHEGVHLELGLKMQCLDTLYFSGFCELSRNMKAVTTIHANCCPDLSAKVVDVQGILRDWKKYKASIAPASASKGIGDFKWTKHKHCEKSWNISLNI